MPDSDDLPNSPPPPQRLPPPPPKIPLHQRNHSASSQSSVQRPQYDPQHSFEDTHTITSPRLSSRQPTYDPQGAHDTTGALSQRPNQPQAPIIPPPQFSSFEGHSAISKPFDLPHRNEDLSSVISDRRRSHENDRQGQGDIHGYHQVKSGPNSEMERWNATHLRSDGQGGYTPSPEPQHSIPSQRDGSISTTDVSSNRAGLSTPESQHTSNTSYRGSENQIDPGRPEQQSGDSFYWHSGRSSSEPDDQHSTGGSTTATPGHSSMDPGSSTATAASTIRNSQPSHPARSTSLSPTAPAVTYGASALGFGGPSDWEYFGDYEAEEIDDEELYTRPKPAELATEDSNHDEIYSEENDESGENDLEPIGQPEKATSSDELMSDTDRPEHEGQPTPQRQETDHISPQTRMSSINLQSRLNNSWNSEQRRSSYDQRPDLDEVIRAWSEAPFVGIQRGRERRSQTTEKEPDSPDALAEASLASTPQEKMLGIDFILKDAPEMPKLPDAIDPQSPSFDRLKFEGMRISGRLSNGSSDARTDDFKASPQSPKRLPFEDQASISKAASRPSSFVDRPVRRESVRKSVRQSKLPPLDESQDRESEDLEATSGEEQLTGGSTTAREALAGTDANLITDTSAPREGAQPQIVESASYQDTSAASRDWQKQESISARASKIEDPPFHDGDDAAESTPLKGLSGQDQGHPDLTGSLPPSIDEYSEPRRESGSTTADPQVQEQNRHSYIHSSNDQEPENQSIEEQEEPEHHRESSPVEETRIETMPDATHILSDQSDQQTTNVTKDEPSYSHESTQRLSRALSTGTVQQAAETRPQSFAPLTQVVEKIVDPYSDLDPWGKASLNRFAAMLREEARAENNKDKLNIFNVFTSRESRLRVILYGTDDELLLPQPVEEPKAPTEPKTPISQKAKNEGFVKQAVERANTMNSLKALPALPKNRESVVISTKKLNPIQTAAADSGKTDVLRPLETNLEETSKPQSESPADDTQYSPGGRPILPSLPRTTPQKAPDSVPETSSEAPPSFAGEVSKAENPALPAEPEVRLRRPLGKDGGKSEVQNYLTNRRSVYRPFATQTQESFEHGTNFGREPDLKIDSTPVPAFVAPSSKFNPLAQAKAAAEASEAPIPADVPAVEVPQADLRRFVQADFDPLLMVLPEGEAEITESTGLQDLKDVMEAIPEDFSFIHAAVVSWDLKARKQREENDRQRHERQAESEKRIDALFDDHEIGYGDISELEAEFKRSEAARKADEDRAEYQFFVDEVFNLVWTRLHYELDQLIPHYERYSKIMDDTLAGREMFDKANDGLALAPTMTQFLALHQKVEIRHQKAFEAVLERDRRLKKTEISPWYTLANIAKVKQIEKQFEEAEKKAIIDFCQQRDDRANRLMDVLDQNTLRGVGANQDYMEAIMKAVRRIASGRAFASAPGGDEPTAGIDEVQKARTVTALLATSSEQIVQTFHVTDMLLNSADYEVSVAKAKVDRADMSTLNKLKEERAKEDQKLMRDLEHRLALIREDSRRTNDEIIKLMLFLGVHNGRATETAPRALGVHMRGGSLEMAEEEAQAMQSGSTVDSGHEERIRKALEEAKKRNALRSSAS